MGSNFLAIRKNPRFFPMKIGTCVLFRTHSISEVRLFRETNYDAGTFYEKIRFHSHKGKTQRQKVRLEFEIVILQFS